MARSKSVSYSSAMLSRPLGDMQRGAWATDSNVKFINVVVVGVTHMDQLAQGGKKQALGFWNVGLTSHRASMELTMLYPNSSVVLCKAILTVTAPVGTSVPQMGHVRDKALFGHTHNTRFQCSESHLRQVQSDMLSCAQAFTPFLEHLRETPC